VGAFADNEVAKLEAWRHCSGQPHHPKVRRFAPTLAHCRVAEAEDAAYRSQNSPLTARHPTPRPLGCRGSPGDRESGTGTVVLYAVGSPRGASGLGPDKSGPLTTAAVTSRRQRRWLIPGRGFTRWGSR